MLHTIPVNYLTRCIAEFEDLIPNPRVRIYSDNRRTCYQLLSDGTCDFLLYCRHQDVQRMFEEKQYARKDIGGELMYPVTETGQKVWNAL